MLLYGLCDIVRHLCSSNDFHAFVFEQKISTFGNSASDLFQVVVRLGPDLQTTGSILHFFITSLSCVASPVFDPLDPWGFLYNWSHKHQPSNITIYPPYIYTHMNHCYLNFTEVVISKAFFLGIFTPGKFHLIFEDTQNTHEGFEG